MRWRQSLNEETGKYEFIPVDEAAARHDGHFVRGDIEAFQSPIDGSIIRSRKALEDHCRKHGVVQSQEFTPEFYEKKARERNKPLTTAEKFARKQEIWEVWNRVEAGQRPTH